MTFDLGKRTANAARDLENMETEDELREQATDVEVTCQLDGTVKEVTVYYRTRNIKVGVDLYGGTVTGYSHGSHSVPILDEDAETLLSHLGDQYERQFQEGRK